MARQLGDAIIGLGSEAGVPMIGGVDPTVLSLPALSAGEGLLLNPLAGGSASLQRWALGLDIYVAQPSSTFVSLLQTGDGDGDLFLRDNGDGTAGVGISGVYDGAFAFDQWNRLIVTFTEEGGSTILRKYLNGVQIGDAHDLGATDRWDLTAEHGLTLLADDDGETGAVALSSVFFSPVVPTPPEVAGLAATIPVPVAGGFFAGPPVAGAIEIGFDNEDLAPRYGEAEVILEGFDFRTPVQINDSTIATASQFDIEGPGGDDVAVLSYADYAADEGVLVSLPGITDELTSYTAVWDLNLDDLQGFQALFQTDVSQDGNGELRIDGNGGIGLGGNFDGAIEAGEWSRIAITVEDLGNGRSLLSKYLNGTLLDSQEVQTSRFTIDASTGFLLMTDDDGKTGTGYLSHFGLSTEVLDADAIAALGGADAGGPFEELVSEPEPLPPTEEGDRTLTLTFDSSFRPYAAQTGEVMVSLDGGEFVSLLTLNTANSGGDSSLTRVNETISLDFTVGADVQDVAFSFNMRDAGNDWWWAIDNITLSDESGALIYAENFEGLADDLQEAVDENIVGDGWTDTPPDGWTRENDPSMPQGTTEWQGWSFATTDFWTSADQQNRGDFTLGSGVVAIADPDEWDDFNGGSQTGSDFNSTITTPSIALELPGRPVTFQLGFDGYAPTPEFGFEDVEVIDNETALARQDNINDMLLRDDGTPVEIDLLAAFGAGATDFAVTSADGTVVEATIDGTTLSLSGAALGHSDLTVTALVDGATVTENFRAIVAGENAYVFAVIPDTQDYTSDQTLEDNSYFRMTEWLLEQQDSMNIAHAIQVGDIVQFGAPSQWEIAADALHRLDGHITYTLAVGNHDQQRPGFSSAFSFESDIDAWFSPEDLGATEAQGGGTYDGLDVGPDTFGNGSGYSDSVRNHYSTITTPDGGKWLFLSFEFGAPDDVLRWAGEVIEAHPDHRVVIDTHSYTGGDGRIAPPTQDLTTDNGGWGYGIRDNPRNVNDGEDMWRELASKYPNVTFTFSGHNFVGGAETTVSYGAGANPTFEMFVNYQNGAWAGPEGVGSNGGNGAMRLIVIDPDNNRFTTHTKMVELDAYFEDFPDHQEVYGGVDFGTPEEIAIAKAGDTEVVAGDGVSAEVELDGSATLGDTDGATFEWFTANGESLGETDGAPLAVTLATGTHRLTLQVTDADGNISTDEKVVIVEAPDAYLTETFDAGDADGWVAAGGSADELFTVGTDVGLGLPAIGGGAQVALTLTFDSSFRPYAAQTGEVMVSFDDGETFSTLLTLNGSTSGGDSSLSRANETVTLDILAPGDAENVQFAWRMSEGGNDWWWAIDNIEVTAGDTTLLTEDFEGLPLQGTVDEVDPGFPVWTPVPPDGWTAENAEDMPQGATEFQGWTFMTKEFWINTAADQDRSTFTLGTGNVAVADPDEWDDANEGAGDNLFDSTVSTPLIDLTGVGGGGAGGTEAGVLSVPALDRNEAILVRPTEATGIIDTYTMVFDILLSETTSGFTALFQTDVTNSGDGDLFFRNDGDSASIGISGDYAGALEYGAWGRVALVFETDGAGQQTLSKYLDGVFIDSQVVDTNVADGSRWSINAETGFLLLTDDDGETSDVALNALYLTTEALDAAAIAAMGGVDVDGPVETSETDGAFQLSFDGAADALDFGGAEVEAISLGGDTSYIVKGSIFGNAEGEGEAALYQQSNGGEEVIVWHDGANWADYTFDFVFEPADNDTVGAVFYWQDEQNHYRLTMNQQGDLRTLVKVQDGVETVLASETASYRHFAMQDMRIAVLDGTITVTLDDELMFGGPITDDTPLEGGTVGFLTQGMDRVLFDNVTVNPITLAARALTAETEGRWATDLDGDGFATFTLTAAASLSSAGIETFEWLVDGTVVATGETASLELAPGETTVTLRVTDADGAVAEDQITVQAASQNDILALDQFEDADLGEWTFVDEGTLNGPSDWAVVDGKLVQGSDIASTQQGLGSNAYSVGGDGPYILRDGTYALWNNADAVDWTDYAVEATLTPEDDDGIGILFRYTDDENYYKLESDAQTGLVMLTRHLDGRESILARGYSEYTAGEEQHWRIEVEGGQIRAFIDGKAVFGTPVEDRTLAAGTIGLYAWASEDLAFDDVVVTQLGDDAPAPELAATDTFEFDRGAMTYRLNPDLVAEDHKLAWEWLYDVA